MTKNFDKGINNVHSKLQGLTKGFADIAGAVAVARQAFGAVAGVVSTLVDEIERLDKIGDTAERLDITADSLVKLERAAVLAGGEVATLDKSLAFLQKTLGKAAFGDKKANTALERLNIEVDEITKLGLDQAFGLILQRLGELPNAEERAAVGADLLGRASSNLTGLMKDSASAIQQASTEVDKFGANLDETRMKQIDAAQKSIERLEMSWSGLKANLAIGLAPAASSSADFVSKGLQGIRQMDQGELGIAWMFGPLGLLAHGNAVASRNAPAAQPPRPPALRMPAPRDTEADFIKMFAREKYRGKFGPMGGGMDFIGGPSNRAFLQRAIGIDPLSPAMRGGASGGAGAFERGSLGAFQAIQQSRREDENNRLQKQEVEETKKINTNLEKILDAGGLLLSLDLQG